MTRERERARKKMASTNKNTTQRQAPTDTIHVNIGSVPLIKRRTPLSGAEGWSCFIYCWLICFRNGVFFVGCVIVLSRIQPHALHINVVLMSERSNERAPLWWYEPVWAHPIQWATLNLISIYYPNNGITYKVEGCYHDNMLRAYTKFARSSAFCHLDISNVYVVDSHTRVEGWLNDGMIMYLGVWCVCVCMSECVYIIAYSI